MSMCERVYLCVSMRVYVRRFVSMRAYVCLVCVYIKCVRVRLCVFMCVRV